MCRAILIVSVLSAAAAPAWGQPAIPAEKRSVLLAEGALQQVRTQLHQLTPFTFRGAALHLDRDQWRAVTDPLRPAAVALSPAESIFRQLQNSAGLMSSSTMGGVGRDRTLSFTGRNLNGRLEMRGDIIRFAVEEVAEPFRSLEVMDDALGGLRLQLLHPDGDMILLNQSRKGTITGIVVKDGKVFTGQASSFLGFLRQHREEIEANVLPVLRHFGLQPVIAMDSPAVRAAVLARLLRTPASVEEGKKLIASLDSSKFEERESATKRLTAEFESYKDLIEEQLSNKATSLEVANRLQKIVAAHRGTAQVTQTVAALELTNDPVFLVSLLDHVSAADRIRVMEHLEKTTGQKLGTEPTAWKAWAKKQSR